MKRNYQKPLTEVIAPLTEERLMAGHSLDEADAKKGTIFDEDEGDDIFGNGNIWDD